MQGAIFDIDGTLLDSMSVWWDVLIDFFEMKGSHLSDKDALKFKDYTLDESIPVIIESLGLDMSMDEVLEKLRNMIFEQYKSNIPLKKGAGEYLKKLHDGGVKIAVATSGYEELCKAAFERLGVLPYIDAYAFSSEVGVNKSNPDVYLLAAERIGVAPEECTVYEDIVNGVCGAKKGGFGTCAVYDSSNEAETETLKSLADSYITDWTELM